MRPLQADDVAGVARLHSRALGGLLSRLGPAAVKAYYRGAVSSELTVAFVAGREGAEGFVFGSPDTAALWREIQRRHPLRLAWGLILGGLARPTALRDLYRSLFSRSPELPDLGAAQLAYIAVAPEARRQGLARRLVAAFDEEMGKRGLGGYELSVEAANEGAVAFYHSLGFTDLDEYVEFDERYLRLQRALT